MALSERCKSAMRIMLADKALADRVIAIVDAGSGTIAGGYDSNALRVALANRTSGNAIIAIINAGTGAVGVQDTKNLRIAMADSALADELIAAIA